MTNIVDNYIATFKEEINTFLNQVDKKQLEEVANIILKASKNNHRLHFTGIGKPSYVAKYMASLYSSTGTPAYFLDGTETVHGSAGQTCPHDVVIAISNSGETAELLHSIKTLKALDVTIIAITSNPNSTLSNLANYHLYAGVHNEGDYLNKPPRLSIISEIILLQVLSLILQKTNNLDKKTYLKWHPGGSIGKDLA